MTPQEAFEAELREAKKHGKVTKPVRDKLKARRRSRKNRGEGMVAPLNMPKIIELEQAVISARQAPKSGD